MCLLDTHDERIFAVEPIKVDLLVWGGLGLVKDSPIANSHMKSGQASGVCSRSRISERKLLVLVPEEGHEAQLQEQD